MTVSVVIVTYNSELSIVDCIESLYSQRHYISEVVIVDNGSQDQTVRRARKALKHFKSSTLLLNSENNIGKARKLGVVQSKSDHVAFIDSDCTAPKNWLKDLIGEYQKLSLVHKTIFSVGGPNELPRNRLLSRALIENFRYPWGHGGSPQALKPKSPIPTHHVPTTNALFNRALILEVGNFSDEYKRVGEDLELGLRAQSFGYKSFLLPKPIVLNDCAEGFVQWFNRMFRFGRVQPKIFFKEIKNKYLHFPFMVFLLICVLLSVFVIFNILEVLLGLYLIISFIGFILTWVKTKSLKVSTIGVLALWFTHVGYFLGMTFGLVKELKDVLKKSIKTEKLSTT